jgi:hypothetical protein
VNKHDQAIVDRCKAMLQRAHSMLESLSATGDPQLPNIHKTSKYVGVSYTAKVIRKPWRARGRHSCQLGFYATEEEAHQAVEAHYMHNT